MKIKAISLWQPWASLIAWGRKTFETRSWKTNYRGPILICAAVKEFRPEKYDSDLLRPLNAFWRSINRQFPSRLYPLGVAVAIADLINCAPAGVVTQMLEPHSYEMAFGDFTPGRWAWKMDNVRKLDWPSGNYEVKGRQGLFEVEIPDEVLK